MADVVKCSPREITAVTRGGWADLTFISCELCGARGQFSPIRAFTFCARRQGEGRRHAPLLCMRKAGGDLRRVGARIALISTDRICPSRDAPPRAGQKAAAAPAVTARKVSLAGSRGVSRGATCSLHISIVPDHTVEAVFVVLFIEHIFEK